MKCPFCAYSLTPETLKRNCPECGKSTARMLKRINTTYRNLKASYTSLLGVAQELTERLEVYEAISAAQDAALEESNKHGSN